MRKTTKKTEALPGGSAAQVLQIGELAATVKAIDIRAYDLRELTVITDYFVVCSASSEPHFSAIFNAIKDGMKETGVAPLHTEGVARGRWRVLDYGAIIVHIFREEAREFYDLDGLWGDASLVDLRLDKKKR